VLGFLFGAVLGISLCYFLNFHIGIILLMTLIGAATFFALAFLAKILTGGETIVYYHHEISILINCSIVLKLLHLPVLNYLDITILGIATFLAFGRIGCFSVGCCHGKPAKKGVAYGHDHVKDGFPYYLESVILFPIQLVESAFVFLVIISGSIMLLQQAPPGTVLIFYTVIYGAFRFTIEFFRGDAERPYFKGLSEAQWTTLILLAISLLFSFVGLIPFYLWHFIVSACLFLVSFFVIINNSKKKNVFSPHHVMQIASGLIELDKQNKDRQPAATINMFQTDFGFIFSKGQIVKNKSLITHYTFSSKTNKPVDLKTVEKLAELIKKLRHHKSKLRITGKQNGIYHILFRDFLKDQNKSVANFYQKIE
jgi:prolipoprotein diacylglyceryltransferase